MEIIATLYPGLNIHVHCIQHYDSFQQIAVYCDIYFILHFIRNRLKNISFHLFINATAFQILWQLTFLHCCHITLQFKYSFIQKFILLFNYYYVFPNTTNNMNIFCKNATHQKKRPIFCAPSKTRTPVGVRPRWYSFPSFPC